ncbi:MAG: entericidin A/B family lipoprotein [Paracoccaceae bacterium]
MRKLAIPVAALLALAACETIEGAGRDLQDAGAAVSHEARKTQADM